MEEAKKEKPSKKFRTLDLAYIGLSTAIIAACSWISIPIGEVPVTLQTMGICLVCGLFGFKRGTLATLAYIALGAIGVPVFSGFKSGLAVLGGPTGGYIIGFIFTAIIVGLVSDKTQKIWALVISMVIGIAVCYAFGTVWFRYVFASNNKAVSLSKALALCVTPFIIPDIVKIIIASVLTNRLRKHVK